MNGDSVTDVDLDCISRWDNSLQDNFTAKKTDWCRLMDIKYLCDQGFKNLKLKTRGRVRNLLEYLIKFDEQISESVVRKYITIIGKLSENVKLMECVCLRNEFGTQFTKFFSVGTLNQMATWLRNWRINLLIIFLYNSGTGF